MAAHTAQPGPWTPTGAEKRPGAGQGRTLMPSHSKASGLLLSEHRS